MTGRVRDVTPYPGRAALVIVPLRLGGGIQVKVLEALAAVKVIVASSLATEGPNLVDGEGIVIAESDGQFKEAVVDGETG